jgi:hypothetical protein
MRYIAKPQKGFGGRSFIVPNINGYDVWSIPLNEYNDNVETAIKRAYILGIAATLSAVKENIQKLNIEDVQ